MFPILFKFVIVIISNGSVLACHQELTLGGSANHQGRGGGGAKLVSFYESETSLAFCILGVEPLFRSTCTHLNLLLSFI